MNNLFRIGLLATALLAILSGTNESMAQKKKKGKKKPATTQAPTTAPVPTVDSSAAKAFNALNPPNLDSLGYNTLSVRPVHKSDIMYRMAVWRRIDFHEKCNEPFFSKDNEISRLIIDAVSRGELTPYTTDSVNRMMKKEDFIAKLTPNTGEPAADPNAAPEIDPFTGQPVVKQATSDALLPNMLYIMELREDLLFDKQRSRMMYDIQTLTMYIPKEYDPKGLTLPIATFRYKDLSALFKRLPNATWYNSANRAEDKKLGDAFDLRMFCSRIIKLSNPKDQQIQDITAYNTNDKSILIASQQMDYELVERENELWDF